MRQDDLLLQLVGVVAGYALPMTPPCTFTGRRGEIIGLWGENGIGKSTVLKSILGEVRCHAGRIEVAAGARLAYLPQRPVRPAEVPLTGRELLRCLGAGRLDPPPRLADRLDTRVDRLSGGEYQLLGLWAALAQGADIVLLDEPDNNLDPVHQTLAIEEILNGRHARVVVLVSHDRAFLNALGACVIELERAKHG